MIVEVFLDVTILYVLLVMFCYSVPVAISGALVSVVAAGSLVEPIFVDRCVTLRTRDGPGGKVERGSRTEPRIPWVCSKMQRPQGMEVAEVGLLQAR